MFEVSFVCFFLVLIIGPSAVKLLVERSRRRERRSGHPDPDDVLAYLEASAPTSPLAERLLKAAMTSPCPAARPWLHDADASTPPEEHWRIFQEDLARETGDVERYVLVEKWSRRNRFTLHEQGEILGYFSDASSRDAVRELFDDKKRKFTAKWSKQPKTLILTMTCDCGKPAHVGCGPELKIYCATGKCSTQKCPIDTLVTVSSRVICVDADGDGWMYTPNGWVKRTLE